jgi:hypothetical protein
VLEVRPAAPPPLSLPPALSRRASADAATVAPAAPRRPLSIPSGPLPFWPSAPARAAGEAGAGSWLGWLLLLGVPLLLVGLFLAFR